MSGSIPNSAGDSLPSGLPGTSSLPRSYFLSKIRAGRNVDSSATSSMTGGTAADAGFAPHRNSHGRGRPGVRLELVRADHFVIVEVEPAQRPGDRRQLGPGEPSILVAVELIEECIGPADRLTPDLDAERAQNRA